MAEYPKRDSHHAHRITRLLFKSCACQEIGAHAALLVIHIAHTEDAVRYQYPVRFWNGQLMALFGWNSPKQLTEARRRAIEAGWLHYEREGNRQVGRYWTLIPEMVEAFSDAPIEPINYSENGMNGGTNNGNVSENGKVIHSENGTISGMIHGMNSGKTSIPIPNPTTSATTIEEKPTNGTPVNSLIAKLRSDPFCLIKAEDAVTKAIEHGCSVSEIEAIADHWKAAKVYKRPQLCARISAAHPGENPSTLWPQRTIK